MSVKNIFKSKWFIIALCACIVCAAAAVFALNFNSWFGEKEVSTEKKAEINDSNNTIFWNVDRFDFACKSAAGKSSRARDKDDGYYHVLFSNEGRQVVRRVKDNRVLDLIDERDVMGLIFDDRGIVVGIKEIEDMGYIKTVSNFYVKSISESNEATVCSSYLYRGIQKTYKFDESTKIYDMSGGSGEKGIPVKTVSQYDAITVLSDKNDKPVYVFITSSNKVGDIYWNVNRMWNSSKGVSTRQKDADGYYTFLLAVNGEQKIFKTRSADTAKSMDSKSVGCFGLQFDNDGYITTCENAVKTLNGTSKNGYVITAYDAEAGTISLECINSSSTYFGEKADITLAKGCRKFDCTGFGEFIGVKAEPKVGDTTYVLINSDGEAVYIFSKGRSFDGPMYYNLKRQYDTDNACTLRKPDAQGWYYYDFAGNGGTHTFKTNDIKIANRIDAYGAYCMGLKLNGDVIEMVIAPTTVSGCEGSSVAVNYHVMSINGNKVHCENTIKSSVNYGKQVDFEMAPGCKVYVVGGNYANYLGEETKLMVTDVIQAYKDRNGRATVIFVRKRTAASVLKTAYCSHCGKTVEWLAYRSGSIAKSGHYTLVDNCKAVAVQAIGSTVAGNPTVNVVLDLNGKTVSRAARIFSVQTGCDFTVMDSVGNGKVEVLKDCINDRGLAVYVGASANFTLLSGTLDATAASTQTVAPAIYAREKSTVNIKGGTVNGGTTTSDGSAIYLGDDTKLNISGGTISGGRANRGGAIFTGNRGVNVISGGKIIAGTVLGGTEQYGAAMYVGGNGTFTMTDGEIIGASAKSGGALYINKTTVAEISGGVIRNGRAVGGVGGNIAFLGTTLTIKGDAEIYGGTAQNVTGSTDGGTGGNIYTGTVLKVEGGKIHDGKAFVDNRTDRGGGGNIGGNVETSEIIISGGEIYDGVGGRTNSGNVMILTGTNTAKCTISGGKIYDTEDFTIPDGLFGGGVYTKNAVLNLSGAPEIKDNVDSKGKALNIYVDAGTTVNVGEMTGDDKSIGFTLASGNTFSASGKDYISKFFADSGADINVEGDGIVIVAPHGAHYHCLECGTFNCPVHKNVDFTEWTSTTTLPTSGGNYYLKDISGESTKEYNLTGQANLTADSAKVNICLNCQKVNAVANKRAYVVNKANAALSITDCGDKTGTVASSGTMSDSGAATIRVTQGTFNLYNGTVDASKFAVTAASASAGIQIGSTAGDATFNMYGGKIIGGKAKNGGSIYLGYDNSSVKKCTANILGGIITGGNASGNGGNIYVYKKMTLKLKNCSVINGVATSNGPNIYVGDDADLTLDGKVVVNGGKKSAGAVQDILLASNLKVKIGKLESGSDIGIARANAGIIAEGLDTDCSAYFRATSTNYAVTYSDGKLKLGAVS